MSERSAAPGDLALVEALVNTLDVESGADTLDTAEGRARFGIAEGEAAHARELRESLRAALLAHAGHPPHRAVTPLSDLLAAAPLLVTVDAHDGAARLAPAAAGAPLLARTAAAVAQALVEGTWIRLKACEAVTCHWAYYDRSPAGRGRWCSMQVCGARAKMRRYRSK
ncbi:CGNR zinc finger domain-containing protein [Streptomyces sp. AK04-3B]|uniref:CGNR zinc finger domain-containing protein n=1 Tax=Streptomyces sp. AK04-3B TaxID=3028650 RepID=UPI0029AA0E0E|nr:CGNR zinc finger domain-containing protein [Streptomyces sp. AK04-3B]MDX3799827.1 CGNR zinc finger domain-containing protein [Streptomyces sp. AK04-3B]